jgi:hypothetical protein
VNFFKRSRHWALWAFTAALLLKSAMPLLATASAQLQGKQLVEVCTAYGVSLVAVSGEAPQPVPDPATEHSNPHCVLTALTVLAGMDPLAQAPLRSLPPAGAAPPLAHPAPQAPDASTTWVARLKHGPPHLT